MKLILIMGMQRSGTTALFETLRTARNLVSHAESSDGPIYDDYFLRPEATIRSVLRASGAPVLLKPVRESSRRALVSVIEEYADYDLSILWLYRDPVNVVFSYSVKEWLDAKTAAAGWIGLEWVTLEWIAINHMLIQLPATHRAKLTVLRYEDLVSDASILKALRHKLGLGGHSTLRPDSNAGRTQMPIATQARIDAMTADTLLELHRFPTGFGSGRSSRKPQTHTETLCASAAIDFESATFQRDPHGCLGRLREHRRHHRCESGNVHWLSQYDEVSSALHGSARFNFQERNLLKDSAAQGEEMLRQAISGGGALDSAKWTARSLEDLAQEICMRHAGVGPFNLAEVCVAAVGAMFYRLLGVDSGDSDWLFKQANSGEFIDVSSRQFSRDGWLSRVMTQASLSNADLACFLAFGGYYRYVAAIFALTAVHWLLGERTVLNGIRRDPERFPATFRELARLTYPLLVVERWTSSAVEVAGCKIPAHRLIYLSIAAANRDPSAFERPDEFVMDRDPTTMRKPISGFAGACGSRAHWEEWGHLVCEALLKVLLTKLPLLEPVRPLNQSSFTITPSSGGLRQALQIPFLRYLRTFEVKFQT